MYVALVKQFRTTWFYFEKGHGAVLLRSAECGHERKDGSENEIENKIEVVVFAVYYWTICLK